MPLVTVIAPGIPGPAVPPVVQILPSDLSNLNRWYDAQDAGTLTGSPSISQWDDKGAGGHDLSQGNGAEQPGDTRSINTNQAVDFDGSDDDMSSSAGISGSGLTGEDASWTIGIVFQADTFPGGSNNEQIVSIVNESDNDPFYAFSTNSTGSFRIGKADDTRSDGILNSTHAPGGGTTDPQIMVCVFNGTTVDMYLEHTKVIDAGDVDTGVLTLDRFNLGSYVRTGVDTQHFDGLIGEVVVYEDAKSGDDLTNLINYFQSHWGF